MIYPGMMSRNVLIEIPPWTSLLSEGNIMEFGMVEIVKGIMFVIRKCSLILTLNECVVSLIEL